MAAVVAMPLPHGSEPATWRPGIAEVSAMQEADLILLHGGTLYGWTERVSLPRARVSDTVSDFDDALIEVEGVTHAHGPEGEHTHAATATKSWLDFELASAQAGAVAEAIIRLRPDEAAEIGTRLDALQAELAALDAEAERVGAALAGEPILAYHAGYEYFARRYDLDVEALDWDREVPPDAEGIAQLDEVHARHPARRMLFETPPGEAASAAIEARGITPVIFETGAAMPPAAVLGAFAAGIEALAAAAER
ncbi:hypothetical protein BH23PSE1_BH23PSE1_03540 [soil metagenome]